MKKLTVLFALLYLTSCQQQPNQFTIKDANQVERKVNFTDIQKFIDEFASRTAFRVTEHNRHDITLNQTLSLIAGTSNSTIVEKGALNGGFIPKNKIIFGVPRTNYSQGLFFYYCYDDANKVVFIAYKSVSDFSYTNDDYYKYNFTDPDLFEVSNSTTDDLTIPNTGEISLYEDYLKNNIFRVSPDKPTITYKDVKVFNQKFKDQFKDCKGNLSTDFVNCDEDPYGFISGNELAPFIDNLGTDIKGIRFHFGYDNTENDNKLRILFIGSGNVAGTTDRYQNIITLPFNSTTPTSYAKILERSYP